MMKKMVIEVPENVSDRDVMEIQKIVERVVNGLADDRSDYWIISNGSDHCVAVLVQSDKNEDRTFVLSYLHEIEEFIISTFKKEIYI